MPQSGNRRQPSRRVLLGSAGLIGVTGLATYAYRIAPQFWHHYAQDLRRPILPPPGLPDPHRWPDQGLFAAWLGHSTVLLKMEGFTILTDPVFSNRAGIHVGPLAVGMKRLTAPALAIPELPPIDLVLLSHAHMDHTDLPSLRRLESRHTAVISAMRNSDLLRAGRYRRVMELGWGQTAHAGPATVRGVEVNHWGARVRTDHFRGYNGYLIEAGRYRVLFAGDTALTSSFGALKSSRPLHLAIMPIGAYDPWIRVHCNPEQAWQMANEAGAEYVLPVHHQTFRLGREPLLEPIERLYDAAASAPERVALAGIGQEIKIV